MKLIIVLLLINVNVFSQNLIISYDLLNRITSVLYPDSSKIDYTYDASGNRIGKSITSGAKITPSNIATPICSGTTLNITFTATGNFGVSNTFTAQLSDTSGSFANAVNIGMLNSTGSGNITATIPSNSLSGSRYKIRIISSSPEIMGSGNATDLTINRCTFNIHAKLFIEGFYLSNGIMNPVIDPTNFPNLCDTIILQLHNPTAPYQILYSDKKVFQTDGTCDFSFSTSPEFGKYFLSIKHRNVLEAWSNAPFAISDTNYWLISENPDLIYDNHLKDMGDGHFALYSGDVDQNGIIDSNDFTSIGNGAVLFLNGYMPEDLTGDWLIESTDFSLIENNLGKMLSRP